jgi:uncharacterized protein YodC (DUF2158 family)
MSLARALSAVQPSRGRPVGCTTCKWFRGLSPADQAAFNEWVASDRSKTQLWEIASSDPDHPLTVGISSMRLHLRTCKRADES